ncbi:MAG: serine/threonine protein kinase [Deltaproteobacteria bacterium]
MPVETLGKYQLVSKISEGGMGVLYRATVEGPGGFRRDVALKVIQATVDSDEQFVQMFFEEAKILSLLSHPNLVTLFDFGSEGKRHYLCLELVVGRDLSKVLAPARSGQADRAGLGIPFAVRIAEQVALGLDYAHRLVHEGKRLQLVHRDVSPHNILVGFNGSVKLTDFGIARVRRDVQLTRGGVVKGKLAYMAPEQIQAGVLDRRSDLFALGIVLWEALGGGRLFGAVPQAEIVQNVLNRPIPLPSSRNPEVPKELDAIVMKALERNPRDRWQSGRDFAKALADFAASRSETVDAEGLAHEMARLFPGEAPPMSGDVTGLSTPARPAVVPEPLEALTLPDHPAEPVVTPVTRASAKATSSAHLPTVTDALGRARFYLRPALLAVAVGLGAAVVWAQRRAPVPKVEPALSERMATGELGAAKPLPVNALPANGPPANAVAPNDVAAPKGLVAANGVAPAKELLPAKEGVPTKEVVAAKEAVPAKVAAAPHRERRHLRPSGPPGTLRVVNLHPWAEILVDGQSRGYSPQRSLELPAGRHRVALSNPEAAIERRFSLDVKPGELVTLQGDLRTLRPATGD